MCGIAAILDSTPIATGYEHSSNWFACLQSLKRRGPDGQGTWVAPSRHAILGHTRLAIVDPTPLGNQPMVSECGKITITYNGELYNAPTLRNDLEKEGIVFNSHCDTEVLLNAWIHWGKSMLDKLLGMYAFAIWNDHDRTLYAAVDHAGMKPLVWKSQGSQLFIASDCDALRKLSNHTESLCAESVRHVLTMSCCPPPMTMWEGIYKLRPGHQLEWSPGNQVQISRYYTPPSNIDQSAALNTNEFDELWEQVVSDHMLADVPVGAFLSGGIDSAAVVIAASRCGTSPTCFTLEMDDEASEHLDALRVANHLHLPSHSVHMGHDLQEQLAQCSHAFDEPQGYSAMLTMVKIAALAAQSVKAVIAGDGGDETFGGYLWQRENGPSAWQSWYTNPSLTSEQSSIAMQVAQPDADDQTRALARTIYGSHSFVHGYLSRVFPGFHPAEARAMTSSWNAPYNHESTSQWIANEDRPDLPHLRRVQRLDLTGFCAASILPKIDRGAMHSSLEVRSPLLDRRLIELGLTQPVQSCELIENSSQSRPQLRNYVSSNLGAAYVNRPKQGFSVRTLSELKFWRHIASQINEMKIVKQGMLNENWSAYVPFGDMTRLRTICMLAHWAESRI